MKQKVGSSIFTQESTSFDMTHDLTVPDEAYGAGWNGSLEVPTKNAVYDKIETLGGGGGGDVTKVGTPADNQVGVWTGDGTIEGTAGLIFASNVLGVGTAAAGTISSNGDYDLILKTGNATTGSITITDGADADISLVPNGTGEINLTANVITLGSGGDTVGLTLGNTGHGLQIRPHSSYGYIDISGSANGHINIVPNGTGRLQAVGVSVPTISSTDTLTNKRITPRTGTTTSSATPTINTDNVDFYSLTAQTADITSFTTNLSGTPTEGQKLWIAITGTAARAITWGASFEASTVALPTTTVTTARLDVGFVWNTVTSKWRCIAAA